MYNTQEITQQNIKELKASDIYVKEYNKKPLKMPAANDILEAVKLPIAHVGVGSALLAEKNGLPVKVYSSYVIESKIEDNTIIDGFHGTIGMLINSSMNEITLYNGANAHACTNLSIFGADVIKKYKLNTCLTNLSEALEQMEQLMIKRLEEIKVIKDRLEAKTYTKAKFIERKGELLNTIPLTLFDYLSHSEKVLRDSKSIYYTMPLSEWTLLSSLSDRVKYQSPSKRISATLELEKVFV